MKLSNAASQEILELQEKNGGLVKPEHVIEHAQDKNSALHEYFEWNDHKAAVAQRLDRARELITWVRIEVPQLTTTTVNAPIVQKDMRAAVSLPSDRAIGGGYRHVVDVLADKERRFEFVVSCFNDLELVMKKMASHFDELKSFVTDVRRRSDQEMAKLKEDFEKTKPTKKRVAEQPRASV